MLSTAILLRRCDSFTFSVAFITLGGITPMLQTLQVLERKGIPGRILTTDYNNLRALIERGETKALLVSATG